MERITSSHVLVPFEAELEDEPNIRQLQSLVKGHESLKGSAVGNDSSMVLTVIRTYAPSINKILKMMGRSMSDRTTKNGEVLRRFAACPYHRFGDMQNRWTTLQRQLQQLDARIRLTISQHNASPISPAGNIHILSDQVSPFDQIPIDYFGIAKAVHGADKRTAGSHRSSVSSGVSSPPANPPSSGPQWISAKSSPEKAPHSLRRRPSVLSNATALTARTDFSRPPWNISTKPDKDNQMTHTNERYTSYGSRYTHVGSVSPTLSSPTMASGTHSRTSAVGSRIPVISPKSRGATASTQKLTDVPALSVSTSQGQTFLSEASNMSRSSKYNAQTRAATKTPEPRRSRPSAADLSTQPGPSMTPTNRYFSSNNTPRTVPNPRQSSSRAPPSSFRATTPTPGAMSPRASSRMSMASYSNFNPANLQTFQPSKYDLLDQHVHSVLMEVGFDLFVGRVDLAMRKGQRKRDDEEWKGDFVFGAGDKPARVKLLKLAGRILMGVTEGPRMKCLVRTGGAWQDLGGYLRKRKVEAMQETLDSP